MSFSVGILYSAQEFTAYVLDNTLAVKDFKNTFKRFSLARPEDILDVATRCNWIDVHPDGICRVTQKGKDILKESPEASLRMQICDLVFVEQPAWAAKIPNGREEASKFFPPEVSQCFKEAGLLKVWDDDVVEWWDQLAIATRSTKSALGLITGRKAEKLTIKHETKRTGVEPHWQSLESNFSGYDVLSQVDKIDETPRKIEVKGSTLSIKEAFFTVSRNEWETAETAKSYGFHLWCLKGDPVFIEVTFEEMKKHIPTNNGQGKWETARIPFKIFHRTRD
jgi:hypothetical protein